MARPQPQFTEEEKNAINKEIKNKQTQPVYKRLMVMKLKAETRMTSKEIAMQLNLYPSSVDKMVFKYKKGGINALLGLGYGGNNRYLSSKEEKEFLDTFEKKADAGKILEVKEIQKAYEEKIKKNVSKNTIYIMLNRNGWRKVMPRSKHPNKASDEDIEAYKKNL